MADKGPGVEQVGVSVKIDADAALSGSRKLSAAFGRLRDASGRFVSQGKGVGAGLGKIGSTAGQATQAVGDFATSTFGVSQALGALGLNANQGRIAVSSLLAPMARESKQAAKAVDDIEVQMSSLAAATSRVTPTTLAQFAAQAKNADTQLARAKQDADLLAASVRGINLRSLSPDAAKDLRAQVLRVKKGYLQAAEEAKRAEADFKGAFTRPQSAARGLIATLATLGGARLAQSAVQTISSFEGIKASLQIVTRDTARAQFEFDRLAEIAKKTPFTLEQVAKAFIRLRSAGLDATNESLIAYGDIAASIPGKQIGDVIEAVADAVQGQDRRLKEFGGGLRVFGDQVEVTLGGVRMLVENNAESIEKALVKIGQQKFGGAMLAQSKTISGQFSNLRDQIDLFLFDLGEAGLSKSIGGLVSWLGSAAGGGRELAKTLGPILGSAVDALKTGLQFMAEHGKQVAIVFASIFAAGKVAAIVSLVQSVGLATTATNALKTAMSLLNATNPFGWVTLAVGAIATLIAYGDELTAVMVDLKDKIELVSESWVTSSLMSFAPGGAVALDVFNKELDKAQTEAQVSGLNSLFSGLAGKAKKLGSLGQGAFYKLKDKMAGKAAAHNPGDGDKAAKSLAKDLAAIEQAAYSASESLGLAIGGATEAEIEAAEAMARFRAEHASASQAQLQRAQTALAQEQAAKAQLDTLRELEDLTRAATTAEEFFGYAIGGATEAEIEAEAALREFVLAHPAATDAEKALAAAMLGRKAAADGASRGLAAHKQALKELGKASAEEAKRQSLIKQGVSGAELEAQMDAYRAIVDLKAEGAKLSAQEAASLTAQHVALSESKAETEALVARQAALQGALQPLTDMLGREFGFLEDSVGILVSGAQDFANTLVDGILQGKIEWGEFGKKMLADLAKAALRAAIIFAVKTGAKAALGAATGGASLAAGGALSGIGSVLAGVLHQGGPAGSGPRRAVPSGLFASAPRYHQGGYAGLKPGEVPAVLKRNELVLTEEQQRKAAKPQGRIINAPRTFNIQISTPDLDSFRRDSGGAVRRFSRDLEREERRR